MVTKADKRQSSVTERDREATERRLIDAIGELVAETGFEQIGVNAIAERAGVSKILIYRYFVSIDGLIAAYIRQHDFWINFPQQFPAREEMASYLKTIFRSQAARLRSDPTARRLYRWELSSNNEFVVSLREQRERIGVELVRTFSRMADRPEAQIAALASLMTAAVTYLAMLGEFCPVYNGIRLDEDAGWESLCMGIDELIDRVFPPLEA